MDCRLELGTPRNLGVPRAGGTVDLPVGRGQGVPEVPTAWQGLGRLAYFAVVSGSPAKFAGVGCPGLRTGSIDPITATRGVEVCRE